MENFDQLISIIIPVYNVEKYIDKCMESILNQTYTNLDIILVDDGSTDNSLDVCNKYVELDERVRVFHKENGGVSSARNCGIENTRGDWIAFVDPDDYINIKMYELLIENAMKYGADISFCDYEEVSLETNKIYDCIKDDFSYRIVDNELVRLSPFCSIPNIFTCWNKIYSKKIFNDIRFNENQKNANDSYFLGEYFLENYKIVYVDVKLYYYVYRFGSLYHNNMTKEKLFCDMMPMIFYGQKYKEKGDYKNQKEAARYALNRIIDEYYPMKEYEPVNYKKYRKELKELFNKVMLENENVISWRQITYKLFQIWPDLAIMIKKFRG